MPPSPPPSCPPLFTRSVAACHAVLVLIISRQAQPVMLHDSVAVSVDFDVENVGNGGAGFAWPQPNALGEQPLHMLNPTPGFNTSDTDEESVHDRDHDYAEPIDHEVSC